MIVMQPTNTTINFPKYLKYSCINTINKLSIFDKNHYLYWDFMKLNI